MKLIAKIYIKGFIRTLTGLHIGGSKAALDIGGVDLNVIKTYKGIPYIPGSTLKGKLRNQLVRIEGNKQVETDSYQIKQIFGNAPKANNPFVKTRLLIPDMYPVVKNGKYTLGSFADYDLELGYTEVKFENTIDRRNGGAIPRQLERVPEDVCFQMKLVYDVYDDNKTDAHIKQILLAMRLLEEDYLGGQGSRGYGRISFDDVEIKRSTIVNNMLGAEEDTNHTYTGNPNPNHGE